MSIPFRCERCGHPIEVDDRLAGKHGACKHCGQPLVVPGATPGGHGDGPALKLRPTEGEEAPRVADHLLASPIPLQVRPAGAEPTTRPRAVSGPDDAPRHPAGRGGHVGDDYNVLEHRRPAGWRSSAGPPPLWVNLPTLTARFFAGRFRRFRDWLYVVSLAFLVLALIGFLFRWKLLLHLGALGVVAANVGMLGAGVAYLVSLPFKESMFQGLANLLVPFYAFYYWTTRWPRMRKAVYNTLNAFVPILLVAIAYAAYEEAPALEATIEKDVPALERAIESRAPALEKGVDRILGPLEKAVGPPPGQSPDPNAAPR